MKSTKCPLDRDVRIGGIVRAALTAGLSARDVAMGTMLGALRVFEARRAIIEALEFDVPAAQLRGLTRPL